MIPTAPGNTTPVCLSGPLLAEKNHLYTSGQRKAMCNKLYFLRKQHD